MSRERLRVALIGCGQIADAHLQEVGKIVTAELVAVCDRHIDLARQAAARYGVPESFDELGRMLDATRPDVLHITTPPHTHRAIAVQALEAGVHIYVEKPFAVDVDEADVILSTARISNKLVCVGHDQLFDPTWEECRGLVQSGELGQVVHVESLQGYNLAGPFGRALTSDPEHWVHHLPGGLFQNTISHALYRITDFLTDERPRVWAEWFGASPTIGFPTELRAQLGGDELTGSVLFSAALRGVPRLNHVYGTKCCLEVDLDAQVIRRQRSATLPGAFAKIEMPLRQLCAAARSSLRNSWRFLRSDIHYFAGMNRLFTAFYEAILRGGKPPIPYEEIRRVTAIMDEIFRCCRAGVEARDTTPDRTIV